MITEWQHNLRALITSAVRKFTECDKCIEDKVRLLDMLDDEMLKYTSLQDRLKETLLSKSSDLDNAIRIEGFNV